MRVTRLAVLAAALLGLAGCGHGGSAGGGRAGTPATASAAQLARTAVANGQQAGSVTADFKGSVMGQPVSGRESVDSSGHCNAHLDLGPEGTLDLLMSGDTVWMKADTLFAAGAVPGAAGKYVTGPASADLFRGFTVFCGLAADRARLAELDPGRLSRQGSAKVGDADALVVVTPDGEKVSIGTAQPSYVLRVVSGAGAEPYDFTFSDYGKPVDVTPPPADRTVPLPAS